MKRCVSILSLAALAAALASPLEAYLVTEYVGYPIERLGTRYTASTGGTISIKINLLRGIGWRGDGTYTSWAALTDSERSRLHSVTSAAVEYWNKVPDSALKMALDGTVSLTTPIARRSYIVVTYGELPSGVGGIAFTGSYGSQALPMGVIIPTWAGVDSTAQELGHNLGFEHSSLGWSLTYNATFGYTSSGGAVMSYARRTSGVLHEDDMAAIAASYPSATFGSAHGTIKGELTNAAGAGIFGANVFAVNGLKKAAVAFVSGLKDYSGTSGNGKFILPRLAPGTYTLVAASMYDTTYRMGSPNRGYTHFDAYYPTSLPVTLIRSITVKAGETVDLGRVVAGTSKTHDGSGTSTAPTPTPEPTPTPATISMTLRWGAVSGATYYWVRIYNNATSARVVDKGVARPEVTFTTTAGSHTVYVWAYVSGAWRQIAAQTMTFS